MDKWWKILAIIASGGLVLVVGAVYWFLREVSDGWAEAWGYPRKRRWRLHRD